MLRTILITLLGPMLWGSTYVVFTETLPVSHPLLTGAMRALPAGLILLALNPRIPPLAALKRHAVIGFSNIGLFFALLFVAAARMPGGLAATLGAIQPLAVILISAWLIGRAPHPVQILAGVAGVIGVGLLVLSPEARPDPIGVAAAIGGALSMAAGTVLIDRWGRMGTPLETTTWQLILGGAMLMPVALLVEGLPPAPGLSEILGYGWLMLLGTAFAYYVWTRGIGRLGPSAVYLALASPVVATAIGAIALGEWFNPLQWAGMALVIGATAVGVSIGRSGAGTASPAGNNA
ncbi:EamA family transporter [Hoeflea ulvae]|uniref:DMT family transporter n=1 Tax=Hoeflea ulvae TaxID=2983764 RepID=A0ABT3YES9_9HYPH|nr:EamA family transporter [Hoeflea ulvae]MCY0094304.1 DMT family transporter [Hoeflea ulvae]